MGVVIELKAKKLPTPPPVPNRDPRASGNTISCLRCPNASTVIIDQQGWIFCSSCFAWLRNIHVTFTGEKKT